MFSNLGNISPTIQTEEYDDSEEDDYDNGDEDVRLNPLFTTVKPYARSYTLLSFLSFSDDQHKNHIFHFFFLSTVLRSKAIVETDPVLREAETESDCLVDRASALDEQKVNFQFQIST